MNKIIKIDFEPTYVKDNGLFVINFEDIKDLPFEIKERSYVNIPAGVFGGNHKHPRWEAFIGFGEGLKLIWQEEDGSIGQEYMNSNNKLKLFIIPPFIPHTVINESDSNASLIEFASESQHSVEPVKLV